VNLLTDNDIKIVLETIREAGKAVMDEYEHQNPDIDYKGDESPITKADIRSNECINEGLNKLSTLYPILSEENKILSYEERKEMPVMWCVDPLDGTKEFIGKNGEFCCCIALIENHRAVAGFIYEPVKDRLYYAVKGSGSWVEEGDNKKALKVKDISPTDENLVFGVSRSHRSDDQQAYINQFKNPQYLSKGSILKMISITTGEIDIYPRFDEKTKEWDIAAGQIILEEAGGEVIHKNTGDPITYNKESLQSPPFIARAKMV
jgi:3'(2'), 5'-bisphosphate nucleotidase